jgi:VRR-NUC domain protein
MTEEYDQTLISSVSTKPLEAIKATRPVVIIDEPHRFKRDSKAFKEIKNLNPQLILRFGATFPEIKIDKGKSKSKTTQKDYSNLVYDLNAFESFNQGLVKAVDAFYPPESKSEKYTVKSVSNKKLILSKNSKEFEILAGEQLPSNFEGGLFFKGGGTKSLSNDLELDEGMKFYPEIFSTTYQEIMISQALDQHFKKERENWVRENAGENPAKIKTLSLFFIDSISSYRKEDGWLKSTFEKLLRKKLKDAISKETNIEYKDFLEKSLENIAECHGGYFAEDAAGKGDEQIQNEVDDILRNKNRLISFKDEKGKWILRRFLFSKWTLREGWDNPNVFVIAKIRSSGSETSKLQEVGRGLRLPVDENGRRLSEEEFRLSYIVDFSESDFIEKLVKEINTDSSKVFEGIISDNIIDELISIKYGENRREVRNRLTDEEIIDDNEKIIDSGKLQELLPSSDILKDKIRNNPKKSTEKVKLRKDNWEKIKQLWLEVSQRYMIKFEELSEDKIFEIAKKSIGENLRESEIYNEKESLISDGREIRSEVSRVDSGYTLEAIHYGDFLKKISQNTNISPKIWHKAILSKKNNFEKECFNAISLANIIRDFKKIFEEEFSQKFKYNKLDFTANTSLIRNGEFVEEVSKSALGAFSSTEIEVDDRNLWNEICYDSVNPEMEISKIKPAEKVLVFGKIPQRAIRIPLFTGGTTSPDFIYAIKNDKNIEIDLFIEAKPENLKESDKIAIGGQEIFLNTVKIEWQKVTSAEEVESLLRDFSKE